MVWGTSRLRHLPWGPGGGNAEGRAQSARGVRPVPDLRKPNARELHLQMRQKQPTHRG